MGLFDRLKEPVFFKETSDATEQLEALKRIFDKASIAWKTQIEQDMKCLSYGISGEEKIAFELKNSHMPMYVLHDLHFEFEGLTAQIDYLIITRKRIFVVECKNLFGNIEINNSGDFIRTMEFRGKNKKEGIYSPITQNKRHLELLKQIRRESKGNILKKAFFDKHFYDNYRSVVVLANPKTVLNAKYAAKEVKNQVIRADQLIEHIKKVNNEPGTEAMSDKDMEELAQFYLNAHTPNTVNYFKKYENSEDEASEELTAESRVAETTAAEAEKLEAADSNTDSGEEISLDPVLWQALKTFRLQRSREEKIKPYFIFNDNQMKELITAMPQSMGELKAVPGFGDAKCSKYGEEILGILNQGI